MDGDAKATGSVDYVLAAAKLFNSFTWNQFIPLLFIVTMGGMFIWVLRAAQKRDDFDAGNFLKDERNKESLRLMLVFICFMIHSWAVIVRTMTEKITFEEIVLYCLTWSGSAILLSALDTLRSIKLNITPPPPIVYTPPPTPPEAPPPQ